MRAIQFGWQVCSKCGGLFFTGRTPVPGCNAGGQHTTTGNTIRWVPYVANTPDASFSDAEEPNWRYCKNCHGLFCVKGDADTVDHGICNHAKPGTKAHVIEPKSAVYILEPKAGSPVTAGDKATAYYECSKCGDLYHNWNGTSCNAGGTHTRQTYDLSGRTSGERYYLLQAQ
jgi:hypothetical protein